VADARAAGQFANRGPFVAVLGECVEGCLKQVARVRFLTAARAAAPAAAQRLV
jgi:hypothetical protein